MVYGKRMDHLTEAFKDEAHRNDWLFMSRDETDDETIIRRVVRDAREMQLKYRACGQTSLYPLVLHLGLGGRETVVAMTTLTGGFGGSEICCALVGGIAAIGLEFGRVDFTEMGGPRSKGHSTFTLAQAYSAELRERFMKRTGGILRCCDLQEQHFGKSLTPVERKDPMQLERLRSGELFSMWSTYACELVTLTAEIACEIILRARRKQGIITPLMALPWYNRTWELQRTTELQKPESES
jgi:hypothetical protein